MSNISELTDSNKISWNYTEIGFENTDLDMQSLSLSGRMLIYTSLIVIYVEVIINPDHNGVIGKHIGISIGYKQRCPTGPSTVSALWVQ